jgi:hypothetical protein
MTLVAPHLLPPTFILIIRVLDICICPLSGGAGIPPPLRTRRSSSIATGARDYGTLP